MQNNNSRKPTIKPEWVEIGINRKDSAMKIHVQKLRQNDDVKDNFKKIEYITDMYKERLYDN